MSAATHWTSTPFPLLASPPKADDVPDDFHETAAVMALLHNIVIRGMNTIYYYAPLLSAPSSKATVKDKADFVTYSLAWHEFLQGHHEGEERHYFPAMEAQAGVPGFMAANVAQHDVFQPGLAAFRDYFTALRAAPGRLDGAKVRALIDAFAPDLCTHLRDEIGTILALGRSHPNVKIKEIDAEHAARMFDAVDKFRFIPLMVGNMDHGFEGGRWAHWPPKPPAVVGWLVRWVFPFPHRGAWRFSACENVQLRPTPLVF